MSSVGCSHASDTCSQAFVETGLPHPHCLVGMQMADTKRMLQVALVREMALSMLIVDIQRMENLRWKAMGCSQDPRC